MAFKHHSQELAEKAGQKLIELFESGDITKIAPLATIFLTQAGIPSDSYSAANRWLLWVAALVHGVSGDGADLIDFRGHKKWASMEGRRILPEHWGNPWAYIYGPNLINVKDDDGNFVIDPDTGKPKQILAPWRRFNEIGLYHANQTVGGPLTYVEERRRVVEALPLIEVARAWDVDVTAFNAQGLGFLGYYSPGQNKIAVGTEDARTWLHELTHKADDKAGNLKERGQALHSEAVADFGGLILASLLGATVDTRGVYDYIRHYASVEGLEVVQVCRDVLQRTAKAVALVLDEAEKHKVIDVGALVVAD